MTITLYKNLYSDITLYTVHPSQSSLKWLNVVKMCESKWKPSVRQRQEWDLYRCTVRKRHKLHIIKHRFKHCKPCYKHNSTKSLLPKTDLETIKTWAYFRCGRPLTAVCTHTAVIKYKSIHIFIYVRLKGYTICINGELNPSCVRSKEAGVTRSVVYNCCTDEAQEKETIYLSRTFWAKLCQ